MRLIDIMCNYQGYKKCILILVFDAYKVKDNIGSTTKYHNIYIAYTKKHKLLICILSGQLMSWQVNTILQWPHLMR